MAPKHKTSFDELRALLGFASIGLANTILPAVIHAANYLIVPYPRAVVTLIELLPVVAVKLSLPFVIHRIPCRIRPLIVAVCWLVAKKVADDTPPNVMPPIRIAISVLASVLAAVMEVSCLGMIGHSGTRALTGWGFGTGAGLVVNAVWPFVLTRRAGKVLRSATGSAYYLVALLIIAHFFILPQRLTKRKHTHRDVGDGRDEEETHSFLGVGQFGQESSSSKSFRKNLQILPGLLKSNMLPLFAASTLLFLQQGVARTLDGSVFGTFSRFAATYGVSVHLGTLVSRSSVTIYPVRDLRTCLISLVVVAVFTLFNAVFLVSTYCAFLLAFLAGLSSGLVYINVLAKVMEENVDMDDREFSLGVVTAGDAAGMVTGGLLGVLLEVEMCRRLLSARRWCHRSR
ncbi:golgi integral membrane protein [Colletotrichum truncatum]|uniref:Golgi integral membrane protein n=1 Tax=Colletotrichum truncatum TaxID=5467 RepID=A0ACC3Z612_COLTU|nr:golgi integral membrane protein [Colletotrichum truncatum]KAF6787213.1 golgi integral membrane protein [Colletotrichum truncatum]